MKLLELDIENIANINSFKLQRINNANGIEYFLYKYRQGIAYMGAYLWKEGNIYHLRSGKFNADYRASEMDCLLIFKNTDELDSEEHITADAPKEFLVRLIEVLRSK